MSALLFGMPTLLELPDVADNVDLCRRLGLAFVELNMDLPACQPELLPDDQIMYWRDGHTIDFSVHMPEQLDLAAFQSDIRNACIAYAEGIIAWASLGASILRWLRHGDQADSLLLAWAVPYLAITGPIDGSSRKAM